VPNLPSNDEITRFDGTLLPSNRRDACNSWGNNNSRDVINLIETRDFENTISCKQDPTAVTTSVQGRLQQHDASDSSCTNIIRDSSNNREDRNWITKFKK